MKINGKIKEHGVSISIATIATWIPLIPLLWFVGKPIIVSSVSEAMADDIERTVKEQIAPMNGAFVALIQRDINKVKKEIAGLKFRQRQAVNWTVDDAVYLADLEIELEALKLAFDSLTAT